MAPVCRVPRSSRSSQCKISLRYKNPSLLSRMTESPFAVSLSGDWHEKAVAFGCVTPYPTSQLVQLSETRARGFP